MRQSFVTALISVWPPRNTCRQNNFNQPDGIADGAASAYQCASPYHPSDGDARLRNLKPRQSGAFFKRGW
jgi:hypothetical protein